MAGIAFVKYRARRRAQSLLIAAGEHGQRKRKPHEPATKESSAAAGITEGQSTKEAVPAASCLVERGTAAEGAGAVLGGVSRVAEGEHRE